MVADPIFSRGVLTDVLLEQVETWLEADGIGLLVGDGIAPVHGGWSDGQAGRGTFVPYVVFTTGPATHRERDTLWHVNSSWSVSYSVRFVGGSRQQADWSADQSRKAVTAFAPRTLDLDGQWQVVQAQYSSLGAIARNDTSDPPYWEGTDAVSLFLERA